LRQLGRFPGLEERRQKRLVALDQSRFTRRRAEMLEANHEIFAVCGLGLQPLDELQAPHKPKPLGLDLRRARSAPMLCIEAADPGLVKLGRFQQEPLGG
jgi:hypothetical protein